MCARGPAWGAADDRGVAVRNADEFQINSADIERILDWRVTSEQDVEIPFKPARVLMQV